MSGFSVVAMMRESRDVVLRFADYYRRLGASEIFIYFNGPAEEVPPLPGVELTICTPDFWAEHWGGTVNDVLEDRMRVCYRHAYARCTSDWMLVVDSDEFVFGDRPLAPILATLPRGVESIFFPTAEAVFGPGDDPQEAFGSTHFRTVWERQRLWRTLRRPIYGPASDVMRVGLMGHTQGKHMVRTGLALSSINGHRSKRGETALGVPASKVSPDFANFHLGHFDALSQARWEAKWRYRIDKVVVASGMSGPRQDQMRMVAAAMASDRSAELFRSFYCLSPMQYQALALFGKAFRRSGLFGAAETRATPDLAHVKPSLAA